MIQKKLKQHEIEAQIKRFQNEQFVRRGGKILPRFFQDKDNAIDFAKEATKLMQTDIAILETKHHFSVHEKSKVLPFWKNSLVKVIKKRRVK
jgi:hypothetical protein